MAEALRATSDEFLGLRHYFMLQPNA